MQLAYVDQARAGARPEEHGLEGDQRRPRHDRARQARGELAPVRERGSTSAARPAEARLADLSGGERNRVHLAKLLRSGGNVLLLDEPTNDLDVDTLRALEEALLDFAGCAVVITHDRWFLDRVATHILAFEGDSRGDLVRGHVGRVRGLGDGDARPRGAGAAPHQVQAARSRMTPMTAQRIGPVELRVLGCLIEKQRTTPDAVPADAQLAAARVQPVDQPRPRRRLRRGDDPRRGPAPRAKSAGRASRAGRAARAAKYRHLFDEALALDHAETVVLARADAARAADARPS